MGAAHDAAPALPSSQLSHSESLPSVAPSLSKCDAKIRTIFDITSPQKKLNKNATISQQFRNKKGCRERSERHHMDDRAKRASPDRPAADQPEDKRNARSEGEDERKARPDTRTQPQTRGSAPDESEANARQPPCRPPRNEAKGGTAAEGGAKRPPKKKSAPVGTLYQKLITRTYMMFIRVAATTVVSR